MIVTTRYMNNEKNKAVLLVRVSTKKQDFDEQEKQLYEMALADGFIEENIVPICEKESGIKLKEEERRGLNRLKEEIRKGGVTCVYAWEVSRIGRKKKVIFSITDYLVEKGIQLVIKEPFITLLNDDGSIKDDAEITLTMFAQFSESEMRNKQARWTRTRVANSKAGVWNGGPSIRYGYTIDEKKRYIIYEEEASIIRLIYDLYTTSNMGQDSIRKELRSRGIELSQNRIQRILKFRGYTGEIIQQPYWQDGKKKIGHELRYPAIISTELFDAAQNKKSTANALAHKGSNYYFGKGLLRCPDCGHQYVAYKHSGLYMCVAYRHDNKDIVKCHNTTSININVLDTLLWDATVSEYIKSRASSEMGTRRKYMKEIEVCKEKIGAAEVRIEKAKEKAKRYARIYADGHLSDEEYEKAIQKTDTEIADIKQDVTSSEEKIRQYQKIMETLSQPNVVEIIKEVSEAAFSYTHLMEMSELVHQFISKVEIRQTDSKGKRTREVTITAVDGTVYEYAVRYECGGRHKHHYWKREPQLSAFIDEWREIQPEIIINRRIGRTCSKDVKMPEVAVIRNQGNYYIEPPKSKQFKNPSFFNLPDNPKLSHNLQTITPKN